MGGAAVKARSFGRRAYFATCARTAGVPEDDVDDAAQEIALRVWQCPGIHWKVVARGAAVDAARRYGPRTRSGEERPRVLSLDAVWTDTGLPLHAVAGPDAIAPVDWRLDALAALRRILPGAPRAQKRALRRKLRRERMSAADSYHLCVLRKRLRSALAA